MNKKTLSTNYKIAMTGVFGALSIIMSFTPLGYLQLAGLINITLMHIPVILVTILAGLVPGMITVLIFGLSSLIKASMMGAAVPFFLNPMVSVLPRILFPIFVWLIYNGFNAIPKMPKLISGSFSAAAGTLIHTVLVMGSIYIFYGDMLLGMLSGALEKIGYKTAELSAFGGYLAILFSTLLSNGFLEIVAATILTAAVMSSIYAAKNKKSRMSEFEDSDL